LEIDNLDEIGKINRINGFFKAMELINSFSNDYKSFHLKRIELEHKDFKETILEQFDPSYKINLKHFGIPQERLTEIAPLFFEQYISKMALKLVKQKNETQFSNSSALINITA